MSKIIELNYIRNKIKNEHKTIFMLAKQLESKGFLLDLKNEKDTVSLEIKLENGFELQFLSHAHYNIDIVIKKFKSKEIKKFYNCFYEGQLKGWKTIDEIIEWIVKLSKV